MSANLADAFLYISETEGGVRYPVTVVGWDDWRPIAKAGNYGEIPAGAHFLTLHPNGKGTPGNVVLVQPVKGSKGTVRVIGGAENHLNGLRLRGIKDHEDYAAQAKQKSSEKRIAEKARKKTLTKDELQNERDRGVKIKDARQSAETKFIQEAHAATGQELPETLADPAEAKAQHKELLTQAKAMVAEAERRLMVDAETRAGQGVGTVGRASSPINLDDIMDSDTPSSGPIYRRKSAEENGLTAKTLTEAVAKIRERGGNPKPKPAKPGEPEVTPDAPTEEEAAKALEEKKASETARRKMFQEKQVALKESAEAAVKANAKLVDLIAAKRDLRAKYRKLQEEAKKHDGPALEPGYQMEVDPKTEKSDREQIAQEIHEAMLTKHVVGFLQEVGEVSRMDADTIDPSAHETAGGVYAYRGGGAFDCLHEIGLASVGDGLIDRDVIEALGPETSAQIVARGLKANLTPEDQKTLLKVLEDHHVKEQESILPEATEEAVRLRQEAADQKTEVVENGAEWATAVEIQKNRKQILDQARRVLGHALGRLESRAALIQSMRSAPKDNIQVPLGKMDPSRAVNTAHALGLKEGQYTVDMVEGEALLTLHKEGQDGLVKPVDQAAVAERDLAMAIKGGELDEENYMPKGFANRRPDRYSNMQLEPPMFRSKLAIPESGDVDEHLEDYVGGRIADGERPRDVYSDLRSPACLDRVPGEQKKAYLDAVDRMFPLEVGETDKDGNPVYQRDANTGEIVTGLGGKPLQVTRRIDANEILPKLQKVAEEALKRRGVSGDMALHTQSIDADHPDSAEAMHRAIAEDPRLQSAYVPLGELTHDHESAIRDFFLKEVAPGIPEDGKLPKRERFEKAMKAIGHEPEEFTSAGFDMFGEAEDPTASPEHLEWKARRSDTMKAFGFKADEVDEDGVGIHERDFTPEEIEKNLSKTPGTPWAMFAENMGGAKAAQGAIQGMMKSRLNQHFADHYGRLTGNTLKTAPADSEHGDLFVKATASPKELEAYRQARKQATDSLHQRTTSGQYAEGSYQDQIEGHLKNQEAASQAQGGLFGMEEVEEPKEGKADKALRAGERTSLGTTLEGQLRNLAPSISVPFEGQKNQVSVKMDNKMDPRQQRAIKAITHLKRMGLFLGAGSGKTPIMLGAAAEIHASGAVKKTIMAVPSIVQAQFGSEAIKFLDPAKKFNVHARPGESYEDRIKAYADPDKHAVVVTHQSLRDDTMKILADYISIPFRGDEAKDEVSSPLRDYVMARPKAELAGTIKRAFAAKGIDFQALMVDEAHGALDRDGKEDSAFSRILNAHSRNVSHMVMATGDPVKNDASEIWSDLHHLDPHKYPEESKGEFKRRYGSDAPASKHSLSQQLSRYWFNGKVDPGVEAYREEPNIPLTADQTAELAGVDEASGKLRLMKHDDPGLIPWAQKLSPNSFEGKPEADHQGIANRTRQAVGTMKDSAYNRVINNDAKGGKITAAVKMAQESVAKGEPTVIFARNLKAVAAIHAAMEAAGVKVTSITGKDSAKAKGEKVALFQPDGWNHKDESKRPQAQADVIVMSDAGATGVNLQRGTHVVHTDVPLTAYVHNQRTARIHRLGQEKNVRVTTLLADHAWERNNWERVKKKDQLSRLTQDPTEYTDDTGIAADLRFARHRRTQALIEPRSVA